MDYAQQLAFFANILEQKRLVTALEGNASMIDREAGLTYITPSGRMKLLLQKDDISVMDESGAQVGGRGRRSSEYLLHEAVYRARPDVNAVVHCHCPYLTAYALRYQDFIVPEDCSLCTLCSSGSCACPTARTERMRSTGALRPRWSTVRSACLADTALCA